MNSNNNLNNVEKILDKRSIKSFYQLENNIKEVIQQFVLDYNPNEIQLGGSFTKGYWYLGNNDEIKKIRGVIYNKSKISDIDIYTDLNMIEIIDDYCIRLDIKPTILAGRSDKKILIYKNDNYR